MIKQSETLTLERVKEATPLGSKVDDFARREVLYGIKSNLVLLPLAQETLEAHSDYVSGLEEKFTYRQQYREENGIPALAFCGYGRCGKDLAGRWFSNNGPWNYAGSISKIVCPLVATALRLTEDEAFSQRHDHRAFWFHFFNAIRHRDPAMLVRWTLGQGDVAPGVRGDIELDASCSAGLIDLSVWIENPTVRVDTTVEYGPKDCDVVVFNDGVSKLGYY